MAVKLLVCVLNETKRLNDLLQAMAELGISGATVIESQGTDKFSREAPVIAGLRHLVTQGRSFNYTVFSVVEDDALADRTMKAIEDHLLPGTHPGTHGIAFTVPVDKFVNFHPNGPQVRRAGETPLSSAAPDLGAEDICQSTFERAMLAALKRADLPAPGLLSKLASGLKSIVEPLQKEDAFKERRRAPRVDCDYQVTVLPNSADALPARLHSISLFGLGLICLEELSGVVDITAPESLESEERIRCKVEVCRPVAGGFHCGLVYHEPPEKLSTSWIAHLLRELGYSLHHLVQRRKLRRIATRIPADLQTYDGEKSVPAVALDIGVQGALIESEVDWPPGTEVALLLGPHENHEAIYLEGMTVDLRPSEDKFLHSIRFYALETNRLNRLGSLIIDLVKRPTTAGS